MRERERVGPAEDNRPWQLKAVVYDTALIAAGSRVNTGLVGTGARVKALRFDDMTVILMIVILSSVVNATVNEVAPATSTGSSGKHLSQMRVSASVCPHDLNWPRRAQSFALSFL